MDCSEKRQLGVNQQVVISPAFKKYRMFLSRIRGKELIVNGYVSIIHIVKGKVRIKFEDEYFYLGVKDTIMVSPQIAYQIKEEEENTILVMHLEKKFMKNIIELNQDYIYRISNSGCKEKMSYYLASLYDLSFKDSWENEESDAKVKEMFYFLRRSCSRNPIGRKLVKENIEDSVYEIASYIYKNQMRISEKNISLSDIADEFDINYYYLSRNFKDTLGLSYTDLLLKLRTNRALELILNTNKKIAEICDEAGFLNMKSMNMSFQKVFGCPPSQVRKLFPDIKNSIKNSALYQEEESQDFIRLKDKKLIHTANFIKDSISLNLDTDKVISTSNNHFESVIELNNIVDISNGFDTLKEILEKIEISRLIINISIREGIVYILDRHKIGHRINIYQAIDFVNLFNRKGFEIFLVLNYKIPKTKVAYNEKFTDDLYKDILEKLDVISASIGLESLRKCRFGLKVENIKDLLSRSKEHFILPSMGFFLNILDKRLGKTKYKWFLGIGEIYRENELEAYLDIFEGLIIPDGYILNLNYKRELLAMEDSVEYYLDLAREAKRRLSSRQELILNFKYNVSDLEIEENHKIDYAYLYTLQLLLKMRYNGFQVAGVQFYNQGNYIDTYIYSSLGVKTNYYYINKFNRSLASDVLALTNNYYITKDGEDITILLYDDQRAYYNYAKDYSYIDYDKIVNYTLKLDKISGDYKMVQLDVNHYNNNLVYKKLDERYWPYLSNEERDLLENTYSPTVDIDFIEIYPEYIFHFSRRVLKYKMIKLTKI